MDVLSNTALRCYWGNPAPQTRAAVIAAVERLGLPETDARAADDPRLRRPGAHRRPGQRRGQDHHAGPHPADRDVLRRPRRHGDLGLGPGAAAARRRRRRPAPRGAARPADPGADHPGLGGGAPGPAAGRGRGGGRGSPAGRRDRAAALDGREPAGPGGGRVGRRRRRRRGRPGPADGGGVTWRRAPPPCSAWWSSPGAAARSSTSATPPGWRTCGASSTRPIPLTIRSSAPGGWPT